MFNVYPTCEEAWVIIPTPERRQAFVNHVIRGRQARAHDVPKSGARRRPSDKPGVCVPNSNKITIRGNNSDVGKGDRTGCLMRLIADSSRIPMILADSSESLPS
jgi:hypothetical protein